MTDKELLYDELLGAMHRNPQFEGAIFIECDVPKNNGIWKGIEIHVPESTVAPIIYPDRMYDLRYPGEPIKTLAERLSDKVWKEICRENEIIAKQFNNLMCQETDFPLSAAVVSYEVNKEWLKDIPHEQIEDLAVYPKINIGTDAMVRVTPEILSKLHITKEEALKEAKKNTAKNMVFKNLEEILFSDVVERDGDPEITSALMPSSTESPMFVLTNKERHDGAAMIACPEVLQTVHGLMGDDYYILPSSVHEVLIVPKHIPLLLEDMQKTVRQINEESVEPIDRLSDNVYEFDGRNLKIAGTITEEREKLPGISRESRHIR